MTIESSGNVSNRKFDSKYLKSCNEGLGHRDYDNDGKTTVKEMVYDNNRLYLSLFDGNDKLKDEVNTLKDKQAAIFSKYAGDDGIFSNEEYANCINSSEWTQTLETFYKLDDENQTFLSQKAVDTIDKYGNNDGKTTSEEFYTNTINANKLIFEDPEIGIQLKGMNKNQKPNFLLQFANILTKFQAQIFSKYAGDDGEMSADEYRKMQQDDNYKKGVNMYRELTQMQMARMNEYRNSIQSQQGSNMDLAG